MTTTIGFRNNVIRSLGAIISVAIISLPSTRIEAQQKELPEVNILTAVSNMAFSRSEERRVGKECRL